MAIKRKPEEPDYLKYKHMTALPFDNCHAIQSMIGDMNFIHIPSITVGLDEDDPFLGLNAAPGYVISSIPVFRTLAAAARHYLDHDESPNRMKLALASFSFAAPVSFQGDTKTLINNPTTPPISFISNIDAAEGRVIGYHDALIQRDEPVNIFEHKDIDKPSDSQAVVEVTIDKLAGGPADTTELFLPEALDTKLGLDYGRFFQNVQSLATSEEDRYSPIVIGAVYHSLVPWYLAGMSAKIITRYLLSPENAGQFGESFKSLSDKLAFDNVQRNNLWNNLSKTEDKSTINMERYFNRLLELGVPEMIPIPKKAFPMYTRLSYRGFSGAQSITFGGPTVLDLSEFDVQRRQTSALFTAFSGDNYAYQFGSQFTPVPTRAAPRIFK
jgi:hypothetical protein